MTAQRYVHDILQPHALPLMQRLPGAIFQQDNARTQTLSWSWLSSRNDMISSLATLKTIRVEELMLIKSAQAQSSPIEVWRVFTVQLSSLSLDHGTKLRAPLQLAFGLLYSFWQPVMCEVIDTQNYFQTEGPNIHQRALNVDDLQTALEAKREEFEYDALIYAKSLCKDLEISFEAPRRIRRNHIFGDEVKMFSYRTKMT
ncbi:uncharacterized protein TNCV_2391501 [Trichonephila clavipes]|nr:uncharacterized protein TNCV_2391501 [Trichonephila clavipes]